MTRGSLSVYSRRACVHFSVTRESSDCHSLPSPNEKSDVAVFEHAEINEICPTYYASL